MWEGEEEKKERNESHVLSLFSGCRRNSKLERNFITLKYENPYN
jgi:hypothetical protein